MGITQIGVSNRLTNRETVGGNSKAGLGGHIGAGQFTHNAVNYRSPGIAGPYYPAAGLAGSVNQATDLLGNLLTDKNNRAIYYPINFNNQIGGISNALARHGPTRAPADGVNSVARRLELSKMSFSYAVQN